MARLFKGGTNSKLQEELYSLIKPDQLSRIKNQEQYDEWLNRIVKLDCWSKYSRNDIKMERWGYFAKLINIVIYEIVSNREVVSKEDWLCIKSFLHVPIDKNVTHHLNQIDSKIPSVVKLKGMSEERYWDIQNAIRELAKEYNVFPIWFEAAWSDSGRSRAT